MVNPKTCFKVTATRGAEGLSSRVEQVFSDGNKAIEKVYQLRSIGFRDVILWKAMASLPGSNPLSIDATSVKLELND